MWLIEMTINGTMHRISTEAKALEHYWHPYVIAFDPVSYSMRGETGGYIEPRFGGLELSPELFENDWPPPLHCAVTVKYTDSDEASAVTIFSGYAHRQQIGRFGIRYGLYGDPYSDTVVSTAISGSLDDVFADYCGATHLNLSLDTSAARSPSPAISRPTSTSEIPTIDMLSDLAEAVNHCFYVLDGTLYLVDMLADNGTDSKTEFDFKPIEYVDPPPYILFRSDTYSVSGTNMHGQIKDLSIHEYVTGGNVSGHLASAKAILERPQIRMEVPMLASNIPTFGQKISFTDESTGPDGTSITAWLRVRNLRFSQDGEFMSIEGEGNIA